jgi:DNA-binding response OmpR family regulator
VARIALLCPDLLFGSKVEGGLRAAGHEVTRFDGEDMARAAVPESDLLVVDLTADGYDGATLVESMRMGRELEGVPALGFYSHVDQATRRRAEEAGFDLVVPRSRMAREMGAIVEGLLAR